MREMTKEIYEKLQPFESHLNRGFYGKYYYALKRPDFKKLVEIYRSLGFSQAMDYSCGRCILTLTSTLGRVYFEYKKKMEEGYGVKKTGKDHPEKTQVFDGEPAKNAKRKVGEYNAEGELLREFDSVTQAVEETGISKGNMYKALKGNETIDEKYYKYIEA